MNKFYSFYAHVYDNGSHKLCANIINEEYSMLWSIFNMFNSISELQWIREEIKKQTYKSGKSGTGQDYLNIIVDGEITELYHSFQMDHRNKIPTQLVFEFIDDCIQFLESYNSGLIPGIIPMSKKDDWVIVPKEYVKEEFRDGITDKT